VPGTFIYTSDKIKNDLVSTYISAENLGHSFHDNWLFKNLTIGINRGRRVALVGINGAGKSTLLKSLSGSLKANRRQSGAKQRP
jgi:ATPase subunit of ABC transporter with duplicated ATPase domains